MLAGMLGGVLLYRPIFSRFISISDTKQWDQTDMKVIREDSKTSLAGKDSVLQVSTQYQLTDGSGFTRVLTDTLNRGFDVHRIVQANTKAAFTNKHLSTTAYFKFVALVWVMIILVTMVYGPVAAFLVELFPTRIRYTSMSLPYHIGNGVFGGLTPFIATLLTTIYTGDKLVGLMYPIIIASICMVIGALYVNNRKDTGMNE